MYVCVYVLYLWMYVSIYMYSKCTYVRMYVCMYVCKNEMNPHRWRTSRSWIFERCLWMRLQEESRTIPPWEYMQVATHTYIHTYNILYTYIHTYIHTYTCSAHRENDINEWHRRVHEQNSFHGRQHNGVSRQLRFGNTLLIHTYIHTYIHTLHTYIHFIHMYIYTYIHSYTHTYI